MDISCYASLCWMNPNCFSCQLKVVWIILMATEQFFEWGCHVSGQWSVGLELSRWVWEEACCLCTGAHRACSELRSFVPRRPSLSNFILYLSFCSGFQLSHREVASGLAVSSHILINAAMLDGVMPTQIPLQKCRMWSPAVRNVTCG